MVMPTWITNNDDTSDKIEINTNIDTPQSAFVTVRYYNEFPAGDPAESLKYYTDFPIQITIKPAVDLVNLE